MSFPKLLACVWFLEIIKERKEMSRLGLELRKH